MRFFNNNTCTKKINFCSERPLRLSFSALWSSTKPLHCNLSTIQLMVLSDRRLCWSWNKLVSVRVVWLCFFHSVVEVIYWMRKIPLLLKSCVSQTVFISCGILILIDISVGIFSNIIYSFIILSMCVLRNLYYSCFIVLDFN